MPRKPDKATKAAPCPSPGRHGAACPALALGPHPRFAEWLAGGAAPPPFPRGALEAGAMAAAPTLLGAILARVDARGRVAAAGMIVEAEAYTSDDPASHSFRGERPRNGSMFRRAGAAYVYRIYGIHRCFNIATGREGVGEAALIRALEPLAGVEAMAAGRGLGAAPQNGRGLCDGPGKICQAMALTVEEHDGVDLLGSAAFAAQATATERAKRRLRAVAGGLVLLAPEIAVAPEEIAIGPRVGMGTNVAANWPRRFALRGNAHVSRPRPKDWKASEE